MVPGAEENLGRRRGSAKLGALASPARSVGPPPQQDGRGFVAVDKEPGRRRLGCHLFPFFFGPGVSDAGAERPRIARTFLP